MENHSQPNPDADSIPQPPPASPPAPRSAPKQENALLNLLLNVLLPVTILSYCSKKEGMLALGPKWALVVAVLLPVGYFIYDYAQRRKVNAFSVIGFVSVLLTGGLGLLELSAQAFALKEASIPLVLAFVFLWSHRVRKPLAKLLLLNPEIMDVRRIEAAVVQRNQAPAMERLMWQGTWMLSGSLLLSAGLNYCLALFFLHGKTPGSEEYNQGIAKQTGWGFAVIALPMLILMVATLLRTIKRLRDLTGLSHDQMMLPR
jgi:hypothetical protein